MKKIIKINSIFFIIFVGIFLNFKNVSAIVVHSITRSAVMDVIRYTEDHYHIDDNSVRDSMERMNVANRKGSAPEVKLFFSPSDPKPGEKITATALPMYFSQPKEKSYFTWYLKQKGCDLCENNSTVNRCSSMQLKKCDENKDNRVTVEDWKITAMKIIAQNGFDKNTEGKNNTDDDGYRAHLGGDTNRRPTFGYHCFLHDFNNGKNYEMINHCEHIFPNALLFRDGRTHHYVTGDGVFGKDEESFWGTDPEDPDTANNGNKDEANVAGLGIDKFTWNYMPGDQVGVAIEGLSLNPTKEDDASMMIMWALPKNKCDPQGKGSYRKRIRGYTVTIPTTTSGIDECLEANLVDPREGNQPQKLEVSLKYYPDIPNNDPEDKMGDILTIESHLANLKTDARQVHYKWKVKRLASDVFSLANDNWEDISDDLIKAKAIGPQEMEGVGKSILRIRLNINNKDNQKLYNNIFKTQKRSGYDVGYLRVYSEANEFFENYDESKNYTNTGKADVIIKVISSQNKIEFFKPIVNVNNEGKSVLSAGNNDEDIICNDNENKYICYVSKNEIIGARVTHSGSLHNFHWTINKATLECNENISANCSNDQENDVVFFPITGEVGKEYDINLIANDIESSDESEGYASGSGNNLQLSRKLVVIDPYVELSIPDNGGAEKKLLGYYKSIYNSNDEEIEDRSKNVYQTYPGNNVNVQVKFHPSWINQDISNVTIREGVYRDIGFWLDGQDVALLNDENNASSAKENINSNGNGYITGASLSFRVNKLINENYNVGFKALYVQPQSIRKALSDIWGITQFNTQEKILEDNINIEVVRNNQTQTTSLLKKKNKIFANLVAAIPLETIFILKMILIGIMLLFLSNALFIFVKTEKER